MVRISDLVVRKGAAICLPCFLFPRSGNKAALKSNGCKDWKNTIVFEPHEESDEHKKVMMIYLTRKLEKVIINRVKSTG
ncbi:hypothetical protein TNIN_301151 [Trichonephila inaurata madagascariensis]|uniref:Uncharacterized protein n=1 Tax=Trichonephila inaurata madagascariensis TaxID=2747483 RepID=A0A8X6XMT6_9ARAC|nr:hypothetical protein TNIN_301151 [Trichonephila inaurata madagascariensis]